MAVPLQIGRKTAKLMKKGQTQDLKTDKTISVSASEPVEQTKTSEPPKLFFDPYELQTAAEVMQPGTALKVLPAPLAQKKTAEDTLTLLVGIAEALEGIGQGVAAIQKEQQVLKMWTEKQDKIVADAMEGTFQGTMKPLAKTKAVKVVGSTLRENAIAERDADGTGTATGSDGEDDPKAPLKKVGDKSRLDTVLVKLWQYTEKMKGKVHGHWWRCSTIEGFVRHRLFGYVTICAMFVHSILLGVYVQYLATVNTNAPTAVKVCNYILTGVFVFEILMRFLAEQRLFFIGDEARWNYFDVCIVVLLVIEMAGSDSSNRTTKSVAEMARTFRVARIFRCLKFSKALRVILGKVVCSLRALMWICLLIVMFMSVVSVCLTQGANEYFDGKQHSGVHHLSSQERPAYDRIGTIERSLFTVFASVTGGLEWYDEVVNISRVSKFCAGLLVCYVGFCILALFNAVNGVFVDDLIRAGSELECEHDAEFKAVQNMHIRKLFARMDIRTTEGLSAQQFQQFVEDETIQNYLRTMALSEEDAMSLFNLLDEDNSSTITLDEFLDGCRHLSGPIRALEMKKLLYELRGARYKLSSLSCSMEDNFKKMSSAAARPIAMPQVRAPVKDVPEFPVAEIAGQIQTLADQVTQMSSQMKSFTSEKTFPPKHGLPRAARSEEVGGQTKVKKTWHKVVTRATASNRLKTAGTGTGSSSLKPPKERRQQEDNGEPREDRKDKPREDRTGESRKGAKEKVKTKSYKSDRPRRNDGKDSENSE